MNKIPDYLIDSMCSQIKKLINDGKSTDDVVNDIKKMNDGKLPRKVEILLEPLKPKKVEIKKTQEGFNFGRLQSLSNDDMSDMDPKELSKLINELAKSYYEHKMKRIRG